MYYLSNNILDSSSANIGLVNVFTIAFIKSFKVPNLRLFATRQTILTPLSLILSEHPVLAFFSVEQLEKTDYKFIVHLKDDSSSVSLQFCEMTYHFPFTIIQLIFL